MIGANEKCIYFRDLPKPVRDLVGLVKLARTNKNVQFRYNHLVVKYDTNALDPQDWTFEMYAVKDGELKEGVENISEEDKLLVYGIFKGVNGFLPECDWKVDGPWKEEYSEMIGLLNIELEKYNKELEKIAESQKSKEEADLIDKIRRFKVYFESE